MLKKDVDYKKRIVIAVVLTVIRLILANSQMMFILPFSAPLDDDLYFTWAQNIAAGNWLGDYNYLTLSKYPFFGIYLAFVHKLGIPYLVANCLAWVLLAVLCVMAFSPVIKRNWCRLVLFAAMIYNPSTWAKHTLRVYRDSIFPILCMAFFVALAGWALRLKKDIRHNIGYIITAGVALGLAWISREDGYWLLPFGVAAITICIIYIAIDKKLNKKLLRIASGVIPGTITLIFVLTICSINDNYYDTFILSDFSDGSFARCFGAMTTLSHQDWHPLISVPEDVRMRMYQECPSFRQFYDYIDDEDSLIRKGYSTRDLGDYKSGQLYWGLRRAADELGIYESRSKAEEFWAQLAVEVEAMQAKDPDALPLRSSVTPPIKMEYVPDVLAEGFYSMWYILSWQDMSCYEPSLSDTTTGQIEIWETFLHEQSNYAAVENSYQPYYTPTQKICYAVMDGIAWIYRVLTIPLLIGAIWVVIKGFMAFKYQTFRTQMMLFILPGMLAMGVFRTFIIAFMEVAAFDIGTYAMYLGAVYPIVVLVSVLGVVLFSDIQKKP